MKIRPVGAELFHADRRMNGERNEGTELKIAPRFYAKAPKNENSYNKTCSFI